MRGFAALPKGILNEANRGEERNCFIVIKTTCKQPNSGANDYERMQLWVRRQKKGGYLSLYRKKDTFEMKYKNRLSRVCWDFWASQQLLLKTLSINILRANKRCKSSWDYTSLSKEVCLEPTAGGNKLRASQLSLAIVVVDRFILSVLGRCCRPAEIDPDTMAASLLTKMQSAARARHFCLIISSTENRFWTNCQNPLKKSDAQDYFWGCFFLPTK